MWLLPIVLAPFIGSFMGVLIQRLPEGRGIAWHKSACARSECNSCHRPLGALELVPIVSYIALRGRCRTCKAPIGGFHILVELSAILVALWASLVESDPNAVWADCALGWTLLTLSWIDLRHFLLPDALTLPLIAAGLAATWWLEPDMLADNAIGAVLGYAIFRAIELGYRALRKRDGLGQGDAKLMAAAGAWVGWQALPHLMLGAALAGIVLAGLRGGVALRETAIPFGPCIALALWMIRLYGW